MTDVETRAQRTAGVYDRVTTESLRRLWSMDAERIADGIVNSVFGDLLSKQVGSDELRAIIIKHLSEQTCKWTYGDDDFWRGECGILHQFDDVVLNADDLRRWQFTLCPNCGGRIDARQEVQEQA